MFTRFLLPLFAFAPFMALSSLQATPPAGGGGDDDDGDDDAPPKPPAGANPAEQALRANAEYWERKARKTAREARNLRDRLADAERQRDARPEMSEADRAAFDAYKALGAPADVKAALDAGEALKGEVAGLKRADEIRQVADVAGYNANVLRDRAGDLALEVRDEEREGQRVKVAYIKDGDSVKPLADYAAEQWADYLPALQRAGSGQPGGQQGGATQPVNFPPQGGSNGRQSPADPVSAFLAARNEAVSKARNPLIPA